MYEQAKDYYIYLRHGNGGGFCLSLKDAWCCGLIYWHMKNSLNIKDRYPCEYGCFRVFCGRKKLNRIVKEIIFLGYDEDVWIQEVEK